jgi:hypothetical protein
MLHMAASLRVQTAAVPSASMCGRDHPASDASISACSSLRGKFKYQSGHDQNGIQDCPPSECREAAGMAYRYVHNPITSADFLPSAPDIPNRLKLCKAWGISLYASPEQARVAYKENIASRPQLVKKVGDHLAVATLSATHGVIQGPAKNGHVTLHEYATVQLETVFRLFERI